MAAIFWGFPCVDPMALRAHCAERGIPHDRWSAKANTFATGPGPRPGRGWVLLKKSQLDALDSAATDTLVFSGTDAAHVVTLKSLVPVARECVTPGSASDAEAVFLLEVADRRIHLARAPADRAFNVTKADGDGSYTNTLNGGSPWTWQQAVDALAGDAGLDTPLALPFTPDGDPANLVYWGHPSALEALCDLLDRLACALCYDPTTDEFSIARLGDGSVTNLAVAHTAAGYHRLWDGHGAQYDRAAVPETIRVRFPRRPYDSANWATPFYFAEVATGVDGATADTVTQIDDDMPALGATGTPSNSAALATRAAERAADWLRKRRYYDAPVLRAWRDFVPSAAGLGGNAVRRVVFDDRAQMQTWAESGHGYELEDWRPLGGWPVWWPLGDTGPDFDTDRLESAYDITADATWEDVGISVDLPGPGRYIVWGAALGLAEASDFSAGDAAVVEFRLALTDAVLVAPAGFPHAELARATAEDLLAGGSGSLAFPIEISAATTVKMQAQRNVINASGSPTWTASAIRHTTPGSSQFATYIGYWKPGGGARGPVGEQGDPGADGADGATNPESENAVVGLQVFGP